MRQRPCGRSRRPRALQVWFGGERFEGVREHVEAARRDDGRGERARRVGIDDAEDVLRDVKTALEVEFYLFERDANGMPTTAP